MRSAAVASPNQRKERRRRPRPAACRHATTHAAASFDWSQTRARPLLAPPPVDGQAERAVRRQVGPPRCQLGEDLAGGRRSLTTSSLSRARSFSQLAGSRGSPSGRPPPPRPVLLRSLPAQSLQPSHPRVVSGPRKVRRVTAAAPVVFKTMLKRRILQRVERNRLSGARERRAGDAEAAPPLSAGSFLL